MKPVSFAPRVIILICTCFFVPFKSSAEFNVNSYNFTYLTSDDGLAQNMVDYIYKDSRGFMWFATWNGLNRFDGYEFVRYDTRTGKNSIKSLFVRCLVEDNFGQLWVGTEEGLNLININSGDVIDIANNEIAENRAVLSSINALLKDSYGRIWIGTEAGLAVATANEQDGISSIELLQDEGEVLSLYEDDEQNIWVGYKNLGIKRIACHTEKTFQFHSSPDALQGLTNCEIFAFCEDGDFLWIGVSTGLAKYNRKTSEFQFFKNNPLDPNSISQDYVTDIAIDDNNNLLIATYLGLNIYNRDTNKFERIQETPEEQNRLNNNFVNSLFVDANGLIWVGTEKGGINKITKKELLFNVLMHNSKQPASLSPNPVNAIFEDSNHTLWIGTVEGGLNKFNPENSSFIHYKRQFNNPSSLSHNAVCRIVEGGGYLWIGTWGGGLNRMKLDKEGQFERISSIIKKGHFSSEFISNVLYDKERDFIWVATPAGLDLYDLETQSVTHILNDKSADITLETVSWLCIDSHNTLWVGTEKGLFCIDLKESDFAANKIVHKSLRLTTPNGHHYKEKINCILEGADKTLWVGTYGNGLFRLIRQQDETFQIKNYTTDNGLSDNVIYAMEEDKKGRLWMSTNMGLTYLSAEQNQAGTFYASDGLVNNQFYWAASCRMSNGRLIFGNLSGAVMFDPSIIKADTSQLSVSIVSRKLYNENVNNSNPSDAWVLHEHEKSFSIEFSSLYYTSPEKIKYAYILDGFDDEWREVQSNRRFVNYTNLPTGKYVFKVKCTNPDGSWSDNVTQLNIRIVPPFYKENWFIGLMLIVILISIYYYNEIRIRNLRRQKEQLEKKVEERTRKVESQKNILTKQANDLEKTLQKLIENKEEISKQNVMLIEQNNKISNQKQQLQELSAQLKEATKAKLSFFTNITHEFRTPLTLILGPIEQALKLSHNDKVIEQLSLVRKNSKYLLSLVNQLMDFRKADEGSIKVNKMSGDFPEFIHSIILPFTAILAPRNIQIKEYCRFSHPCFKFDADLMHKILINLLSNAMKFTPENGHISVIASILDGKGSKKLYVSVKDTGQGISEDEQKKIFESFYQARDINVYPVYGQSGTGIGLFLCKQLVDLLGGEISVKSTVGKGSSFRVLIPLEDSDFDIDEIQGFYKSAEFYNTSTVYDEYNENVDDNKPTLLIVEDNSDMRAFIKSILESKFNIIEASNGESGLNKTFKHMPDFIITDLMMPVMDGVELCRKLKNNFQTSHIPVLMLTAKSSTDAHIEGYKAGADEYITKPFDAELLITRITNMIEGRNRLHKAFELSLDVRALNIHEESKDHIFLDKLMTVMSENYQNATFDVTELSEKMHLSKSLLHKKLQSLVGQSAVRMIRSYRLTKAKELIEMSKGAQINISEIAYGVGFNDPKYFTRCFTQTYGIAPSSFL